MAHPNTAPFTPDYADLRSAANDKRRQVAVSKKYYNFSMVKAGQIDEPHYFVPRKSTIGSWTIWPVNLEECTIAPVSKRQLWEEARRLVPRCHHKGRCPEKGYKYMKSEAARQELRARYEGQCWDKAGAFSEFTDSFDGILYLNLAWWDAEDILDNDFENWQDVWDVAPDALFDQFGGVSWGMDWPLDMGALIQNAKVDKRLRGPRDGANLRDWTEVKDGWEFSPDYQFVDDEDAISEFELV